MFLSQGAKSFPVVQSLAQVVSSRVIPSQEQAPGPGQCGLGYGTGGILYKWIPTQVNMGFVFVALWYYNKTELLVKYQGDFGPGSSTYKYLSNKGFVGAQLAKMTLASTKLLSLNRSTRTQLT